MYSHVVAMVPITVARAQLPELLDRVRSGEEITITRHGEAVAVLVRPDVLRGRRNGAVALLDAEVAALSVLLARDDDGPTLSAARADELVRDVRAGRARSR